MLDAHSAPDALARPPVPPVAAIDPPTSPARPVRGDALFAAAQALLPGLEAGQPLDAATLRDAMTEAFGASDAEGGWIWKDAYEAAEAAVVLFLQRYGRPIRDRADAGPDGSRRMLRMLEAVAALEPSHTRRSEEQVRLAGHVPTALVTLTLEDALNICDKLNRRLGYDREAWTAMAAASMHAEDDDPDSEAWH